VAIGGFVALIAGPWIAASFAGTQPIAFVKTPVGVSQPSGHDIARSILAGKYVDGMHVFTADLDGSIKNARSISEGFACATDPAFSFDGARLLFAGKRTPEDRFGVWELPMGGPQPQLVVNCSADCISPSYMPDGRIVYASLASQEYEEHGGEYSFSLYSTAQDGEPTHLTFNPSSDFDPQVLPDGRILYSSWQHVGNNHWPRGIVGLMLVNSDGTGVYPLTGFQSGMWLKRANRAMGSDRIVFVQSDRLADFGAGALAATSLNDAAAAYETLVPAERFQVSGVAPLPDGKLLLSARPTDKSRPTFGLYLYEDGAVRLLYDDPDNHLLAPAVGGNTKRPEILISTVVPDTPFGYLAVLDCYEIDQAEREHLRKGSVASVRVIEGIPLRHSGADGPTFFSAPGREDEPQIHANSATGYIPARILGEVPPAEDGSVYLKVPADRPLRLQLLDREGFAIVDERSWFWVRPNERRVCIGCHESRELAPRNAVPQAVRRVPTDLTDATGWQTVSFRKAIQPILSSTCAVSGCHVPPNPTAGMNLTADLLNDGKDAALADRFGPAYANLLVRQENKPAAVGGRRVHPGDARRSPMLWMLYGRALAAQYKPAPFDTPMVSAHPGPMLPGAQLELIRKWIDLGALYDADPHLGAWPYTIPQPGTIVMEKKPDGE